MDPETDKVLTWIAREALKAPLPENWKIWYAPIPQRTYKQVRTRAHKVMGWASCIQTTFGGVGAKVRPGGGRGFFGFFGFGYSPKEITKVGALE